MPVQKRQAAPYAPFFRVQPLTALAARASTNAGEARRGLDLPRRDVLLWVCAIIFFNQLFAAVNEPSWASPELMFSDIATVGVFHLMAWYAVFRLLALSDRARLPNHGIF